MKSERYPNLIGQKFGRLTVISEVLDGLYKKRRERVWYCQCECKKYTYATSYKLTSSHTKSCGCIRKDNAIKQFDAINSNLERKDPFLIMLGNVYRESYNDGNILLEQYIKLAQQRCFYCGILAGNERLYKRISSNFSVKFNGLDRVNSSEKVHNIENVVPCCGECNFSKSNMSLEEFVSWIIAIHKTTENGRNDIYEFQSKEDIFAEMLQKGFYTDKVPPKQCFRKYNRTSKGLGLYNRYWNYTDNNELAFEYFYVISQMPCYYCGTEPIGIITYNESIEKRVYNYNGLDRKDQDSDHRLSNIVPCCKVCNMSKQERSRDEFLAWAEKVYQNLGGKGIIGEKNELNMQKFEECRNNIV